MEAWPALLTALVGSAGIAAIVTAALQLSRAARLRRSILNAQKILELTENPVVQRALKQSIATDSTKLAVQSMVGFGWYVRYLALAYGLIVVVLVVTQLLGGWFREKFAGSFLAIEADPSIKATFGQGIFLLVILLPLAFLGADTLLQLARRRMVNRILVAAGYSFETPEIRRHLREMEQMDKRDAKKKAKAAGKNSRKAQH